MNEKGLELTTSSLSGLLGLGDDFTDEELGRVMESIHKAQQAFFRDYDADHPRGK